jgi:hypothetical protein
VRNNERTKPKKSLLRKESQCDHASLLRALTTFEHRCQIIGGKRQRLQQTYLKTEHSDLQKQNQKKNIAKIRKYLGFRGFESYSSVVTALVHKTVVVLITLTKQQKNS